MEGNQGGVRLSQHLVTLWCLKLVSISDLFQPQYQSLRRIQFIWDTNVHMVNLVQDFSEIGGTYC